MPACAPSAIGMLFQSGQPDRPPHRRAERRRWRNGWPAESSAADRSSRSSSQVGLAIAPGRVPAELSGGEAARAGLAVALANAPDVVLADEPTGELDESTADGILGLLRATRPRPAPRSLIVTHDPAVVGECRPRDPAVGRAGSR